MYCGFSLAEAVLTCTHNLCFEQTFKKYKEKNLMKFSIFAAEKNLCILHGQIFVMFKSSLWYKGFKRTSAQLFFIICEPKYILKLHFMFSIFIFDVIFCI